MRHTLLPAYKSNSSLRHCHFSPTTIFSPQVKLKYSIQQAATDIVTILKQPSSPTTTILDADDPARTILLILVTQLHCTEKIQNNSESSLLQYPKVQSPPTRIPHVPLSMEPATSSIPHIPQRVGGGRNSLPKSFHLYLS